MAKTGHFQTVPFHRKIRVLPPPASPTAQALLAEVAATLEAVPSMGAALGALETLRGRLAALPALDATKEAERARFTK